MSDAQDEPLRQRSLRTLAWIGDAEFEREVRLRLARRGDYPTDKLDKLRAGIVNAVAQAELLAGLLAAEVLDEREQAVVRRGRNTAVRAAGTRSGSVREYRAATALEALIAWWILGGERERFEALVIPEIEARIEAAIAGLRKRR
ncbi:ribonuclease III [Pseudenhygromyxa sp. WMMC2535]|uniref:ribonuclease III domain-containing protein n=1 Tax=Pseudenhygromyxa sp. WMMC2535 TaxID=2712867 RepID=UPI0015530367|nr:ribonuclease III [Pseudenhygromyxa sp. WMMC2535]